MLLPPNLALDGGAPTLGSDSRDPVRHSAICAERDSINSCSFKIRYVLCCSSPCRRAKQYKVRQHRISWYGEVYMYIGQWFFEWLVEQREGTKRDVLQKRHMEAKAKLVLEEFA